MGGANARAGFPIHTGSNTNSVRPYSTNSPFSAPMCTTRPSCSRRRRGAYASGRAADGALMAGRTIQLVDVTLRDAHQCLWATRMTTAMMAQLAPRLDRAGFEAIELRGGAVFDVCVRYLREDPWERMRIVSSWVTKTPLIVMTRGQSLFTFEFFPDDIVELTA